MGLGGEGFRRARRLIMDMQRAGALEFLRVCWLPADVIKCCVCQAIVVRQVF